MRDHPFIGKSFILSYSSFQTLTNLTFANGISQLSGVNVDYINGILNGTVSAPFVPPLDCIETELLSYITYSQNVFLNIILPLVSITQISPGKN